jgi:hypothetical protein
VTADGWLTLAWAALLLGGTAIHAAHHRYPAGHRGVMVVNSPGLPEGYVPPSASLTPPRRNRRNQ